VPIDLAKAVADKLVAGEPVEFAFLGVSSDSQTTSLVGDGAIIVGVTSGSPADAAGLQEGDRITGVDSAPVRDSIELGARVRSHAPGDKVHITFVRDGNSQTIDGDARVDQDQVARPPPISGPLGAIPAGAEGTGSFFFFGPTLEFQTPESGAHTPQRAECRDLGNVSARYAGRGSPECETLERCQSSSRRWRNTESGWSRKPAP